jgi:tight adherence protein B
VTGREAFRRGKATAAVAVLSLLALPATAATAQSAPTAPGSPRNSPVVLVLLDNHQAHPGQGIPEKRKVATLRYVSALPADVRVGLITFAANWKLLVSPTTDRSQLAQALRSAQYGAGASTGIYAAITGAESLLRRLGATGRLVILSNAEAVISRPSFTPTVPIDVVPWHYDSDDNIVELQALAAASRGRVAAPTAVPSLASALPSARAPAPAPTRNAAAPARRSTGPSWSLIGGLACVFLVLLLIAMRLLRPLTRAGQRQLTDQIDRYGPRQAPGQPEAEGTAARTARAWASSLLRSTNTERGLAERLDWAGITRSPAEWVLLAGCLCAALAALLTVLTRSALLGIPVGVLVGWLGMRLVLNIRIGRRRAAFREQLPDVLQLIAGSLQSGFSLPQALDTVVREDTQPAAGEFSRALAEARIGANLEDSLEGIASRMDSVDLRWTVMAIRIQREVGGNLAEVLRNTVATMRERAYLHRHVRALSAEGRISAYILIALPLMLGAWLFLTDRGYLTPLYTTLFGWIMLVGAAVLFVVGVLWMRVAIKVEV